jgi:hypothetical protein
MGVFVGKHIARRIATGGSLDSSKTIGGNSVPAPFEYRHAGSFSYVGDGSAVMEVEVPLFGKVVLKGTRRCLQDVALLTCLKEPRQWPCGGDATCLNRYSRGY